MRDHRKHSSRPRRPRRVKTADIDRLVDQFAAAVNAGHRNHVSADVYDIPQSVLFGDPDEYGQYDWAIRPYAPIDWIEPIEQRLPRRFPAVYRSLVTRYTFPNFEVGGVHFFANTPEGTAYYELRRLIFSADLFRVLQPAGYLQIGQPRLVNYDPVCFAPGRRDSHDSALVQLDHEWILIHDRIEIVCEVAPSFQQLMASVIEKADRRP